MGVAYYQLTLTMIIITMREFLASALVQWFYFEGMRLEKITLIFKKYVTINAKKEDRLRKVKTDLC